MIRLDTNILVRFLVEDDKAQTRRVLSFLPKAIESDEPCYVSDVVLCKLAWVLERSYKINYLIREMAREAGCEAVATLDGDLLKEPGFISI